MVGDQFNFIQFLGSSYPIWIVLPIAVLVIWFFFFFLIQVLIFLFDIAKNLCRIADALDKKVQGDIVREIK